MFQWAVSQDGHLRDIALVSTFLKEKLQRLDVVAVIREELPGGVDLQGMDLMKRHKLIPASFGARQLVKLLRRCHHAVNCREISFLVGLGDIVPAHQDLISNPVPRRSTWQEIGRASCRERV